MALSQRGGDMEARFEAELAEAAVAAAMNQTANARRTLEALLALANRDAYVGYALQAQLQLGELELKSNPKPDHDRLRGLQREAQAKGFLLIAHQAAAAP